MIVGSSSSDSEGDEEVVMRGAGKDDKAGSTNYEDRGLSSDEGVKTLSKREGKDDKAAFTIYEDQTAGTDERGEREMV